MTPVAIVDLDPDDGQGIDEVAALLVTGFTVVAPHAWTTMAQARQEVRESCAADRISRVARDQHGAVVGWIAGRAQYDGHVWELHPLVVRQDCRGQGIGRALVRDLERCV